MDLWVVIKYDRQPFVVPPQKQFDYLTALSIFRAELYAITMALNIIYRRKENNFIIFSDSMSSLQAVKSFRLEVHGDSQLREPLSKVKYLCC